MRSLTMPPHDARSTLALCAENVDDDAFRQRLVSVADEIEAAETQYRERGRDSLLYTILEATNIAGRVEGHEMKRLYKGTFSRKTSPVRVIYDEIRMSPRNGICPLCAHRNVSTLDHYLASSRHPALSVMPVNLVPACADCNKTKLHRQPATAPEQTLHPYFDEVDDATWLIATLIEGASLALIFSASPPDTWPGLKQERVRAHFQTFGLATLYASHAAEELVNIRHSLERIAVRGGAIAIREHLTEQAESHRVVSLNSWRLAMYETLAISDWFCHGGYDSIPH